MKKKKNVMMCIILCLICIILLLSKTTQANKTDTYDVILFWGESNMVGSMSSGNEKFDNEIVEDVEKFSKITKIDKDILYNTSGMDYVKIKQEDETVFEYKYSSDSLEEISENTKIFGEYLSYNNDSIRAVQESFGVNIIPEFCRKYYELTGRKVIVVMAAAGGQPISGYLPKDDVDYNVNDAKNNGYIYEMMVEKYNAAITYLDNNNYKIGSKLYVAIQGESDVYLQTTQDEYERLYLKVHNNLKNDLDITGGAIVYTADLIGNRYNGVQTIHMAQESLVRENSDIILGSSYLYDRYIPEKSIYEGSSYINNNYIDEFGNKLGYNEVYNYATYNVCTPDNAIHFTSATLTHVGRDVAKKLANFGYYGVSLKSSEKTPFDVSMIFSDLTTFNKYTLKYDSDVYIKGTITYRINGVAEKERFFLEPNTDGYFSSFVNGYIDGRSIKKTDIISIDFENISDKSGNLKIYYFDLVSFSNVNDLINNINGNLGESDYIKQQTIFIGNDNIKLGLSLRFGGSINYISGDGEIFTDNYANINLINSLDNGRFIQQCYYGNDLYNDKPYVSGACDNIAGLYNPIQGGYISGECDDGESLGVVHSSKIVDIGINSEKNNITIITKPSLWALTNEQYKNDYYDYYGGFTADAYMITNYTIYDTYISVSNSYIDFTDNVGDGFFARSESPSVYTISALSDFYSYSRKSDSIRKYEFDEVNSNGLKVFINDEEFKSDGSYENAVWSSWGGYFSTNDGVTEGLGIYRPDYDGSSQYLLGFAAGNAGDKSSFSNSTSFFTSIIYLDGKISKFKKVSYDYVVTLGNINNIHTIMNTYRSDHSYTLSIDPNDGIYNSSSNITTFSPDLMAYWGNWCTIGVASRKGYNLVGYYDSPTGGNIVYDSSGIAVNGIYWKVNADDLVTANSVENKYQYIGLKDLIVYARWEPIEYKINYDLAGGSVIGNPSSYTAESSAITLNNPTRKGYTFAGWTGTGLNSATMNVMIASGSSGDRSYVATWVDDVKRYIVTYNATGGSVENTKFEVIYGNPYGDLLIPKKNGYDFIGWYLENTYQNKIDKNTIVNVSNDHTLYAKWQLKLFDINESSNYIQKGDLITNITSGIRANEFDLGLDNMYNLKIYNRNNVLKNNDLLFTGDILKIYLDEEMLNEFILVIKGDVNGDGVVGINDIIKLSKHYLDYDILTKDEYIYAGDFNFDEKIDINDIIKLSKYIIYEK